MERLYNGVYKGNQPGALLADDGFGNLVYMRNICPVFNWIESDISEYKFFAGDTAKLHLHSWPN